MSAAMEQEDEGGFDICNFSLQRENDRGPLQMLSGERMRRLEAIEAAAVRWARERSASALVALESVLSGNS